MQEEIQVVEDEEEMVEHLLKGMRKHETCFAFYYEGIEEDFRKYQERSYDYQDFLDKLAKRDGYLMGIVLPVNYLRAKLHKQNETARAHVAGVKAFFELKKKYD